MCLYPKLIPNKRYLPTKKNGGVPPVCPDERLRYVTAACGDCYECRKQKQRQWVVRMSEENRQTPNAYFLTLTIDDKSYKQLKQKYKLKANIIASQRPQMFQGPLGQAIGLFQSYQFNIMQQLLRHVGEGNAKDALNIVS